MSTDVEAPESEPELRGVGESFRSIVQDLRESASVETVYGEPVSAHGKTLIPVARVAYGFGSGYGPSEGGNGGAGGLGGGVSATPTGVVEVTDGETRFVRHDDRRRMGLALVAGLVLGLLLGRRRASD